MSNNNIVPKATMHRYPIYLKALHKLDAMGVEKVLSTELSELVGINATTIRRDFTFVGSLGKQGTGYSVKKLIEVFNYELGAAFDEKIILIGCGNLGQALLNYNRWDYVVGEIVMAFDINPDILGEVKGVPVYHIDMLEEKIPKNCRIAILTASTDSQSIVDRLGKLGVIGLVDFTHTHIKVPKGMVLKTVDVVSNIQELVFETNSIKKFKK